MTVLFDVALEPIAPQLPVGWQVWKGVSLAGITEISTPTVDTVRVRYTGAAAGTRIVWSGTGVAPTAAGGGDALPFDLPSPWP